MDRPRRPRAAVPALFDGPHGPAPGGAEAQPPICGRAAPQLLWIIDIYGFLVAGSLITMGTLGDRIGRRRLLLIGAAAFGVASVVAAFSTSAEMLIATRALLGVAGATLAPSTLSLIRNMFLDPRQRTTAIGVWITSFSVGGAIGPLVGGVLLEHFWWGSVFLLGVPVMVLLLVVGPMLLPEYRDPERRPARPAQRGAVARRRAGGDLRAEADRRRTASAARPVLFDRWRASPSASSSCAASCGWPIR